MDNVKFHCINRFLIVIAALGLWKIGLFRSRFEDGYGERLGPYVDQLLSEDQAGTKLRAGRPTQFTDLRTQYNLNEASFE